MSDFVLLNIWTFSLGFQKRIKYTVFDHSLMLYSYHCVFQFLYCQTCLKSHYIACYFILVHRITFYKSLQGLNIRIANVETLQPLSDLCSDRKSQEPWRETECAQDLVTIWGNSCMKNVFLQYLDLQLHRLKSLQEFLHSEKKYTIHYMAAIWFPCSYTGNTFWSECFECGSKPALYR